MAHSDLIRWGGLAAVIAAALFVIADLVVLVLAFGQQPAEGLLIRAAVSGSAGLLLALGLVGLYAHQAQEAGYLGLVGFLAAFVALWLGQKTSAGPPCWPTSAGRCSGWPPWERGPTRA